MKFSLCIPMYNEAAIIERTAKTLSSYMSEHFDDYEIIFSDDGSADDSAALIEALSLPRVHVIRCSVNRGKGAAVREAMLASRGDIVMFTDSDLAYGTKVITRIAEFFEGHPEVGAVVGSRNVAEDGYEGYTFFRKLASKIYIKILCVIGGLKLSDSQCGCKAFRGDVARRIFSLCEVDGFAFDFEAILLGMRLGICFYELPVKVINHRESKVHVFSDAFKMLKDLWKIKKRVAKLDLQK